MVKIKGKVEYPINPTLESFNVATYSPTLKGVARLLVAESCVMVEDEESVARGGSRVDGVEWWQWRRLRQRKVMVVAASTVMAMVVVGRVCGYNDGAQGRNHFLDYTSYIEYITLCSI